MLTRNRFETYLLAPKQVEPFPFWIGKFQLQLEIQNYEFRLYLPPSYPPTPFSLWLVNESQSPLVAQLELLPYRNLKNEIDEISLDDWQVLGRREPLWTLLQTKNEKCLRGIGRKMLYVCLKILTQRDHLSLELPLSLQAVGGSRHLIDWETIPSELEAKKKVEGNYLPDGTRPFGTLLGLCCQNEQLVNYYKKLGFIQMSPLSTHVNMEAPISKILELKGSNKF